jgi:cytochrome P450
MSALPPGPKPSLFRRLVYWPGRNPLEYFTNIARTYGDLAYVRLGGEHVFIVSDPQLIRDVLITHSRNFTKSRGLDRSKRLLGEGLLTSEGAVHLRQRRLMQPAFHRERIAGYAATMVEYADRQQRSWRDNAALDLTREMSELTLSVVGKTLFGADVQSQAQEVRDALAGVMASFWMMMLPFSKTIERLPLRRLRRSRQSRERLDAIIYRLIRERRDSGADRGDLLSMLVLAQDEEDEGRRMTDAQVRDEAMTIFLAGHETTANALTWTWYLLSQAPAVERALHEEVDRVLGGRPPSIADIPALAFVERVVTEAMRLYPPAWIIGRRAIAAYEMRGYTVPARSIVLMSQWIVHRDGRYYTDPERFDPDRWTPEFKASIPPFAYFPFGGGPRRCIGESFAWMELTLILAMLAQRWRFDLVPHHPVVPQPLVTLRAKHGMKMTAHRRFRATQ